MKDQQQENNWLSQLGIRSPLSKIPLLGDILFQGYNNKQYNQ